MTSPRPFKIQIFVADGVPEGLRIVEKSNWTGLGLIFPRRDFSIVKSRPELLGGGVYLLLGRDEEEGRPSIYVGQSDQVRRRLENHHANKDFWTQAIVFTARGNPLHVSQVQYLEARLVELAKKHRRCVLENGNQPTCPALPEADQAEIEVYLEEMLSLLPILGVHAFEPIRRSTSPARSSEPGGNGEEPAEYRLKGPDCDARGAPTAEGFAVFAGSRARTEGVPALPTQYPGVSRDRDDMVEDGRLLPDGASLVLQADAEFSSPSRAAAVFLGRNANGWTEWKTEDGSSLDDRRRREAAEEAEDGSGDEPAE